MTFDRGDRLKLLDTPPRDLQVALATTIGSPNISRTEATGDHFEIKMHGSPWYPHGVETVRTRIMVLRILETMERFGYSLYASIDQDTSADDRPGQADVLHFHRQKGWTHGMPVWHR
jgi:hypothetical protein